MEAFAEKLMKLEQKFLGKIDKTLLKTSFVATIIFSMMANAYAYFNFYPQHDGLNHLIRFTGDWENKLGRFMLPVLEKIRGLVTISWLEGIFAMTFISLMVYFIARLFNLCEKWQVVLIAGFLSANLCVTEVTSVFTYLLGAFMLSALLACAAAYLLSRYRSLVSYLLAGVCIVISLGLYQGEIAVALTLLSFAVIKDAFADLDFRGLVRKWLPAIIVLGISAVIYFCLYKVVLIKHNIAAPDSYNSLSNLSSLGIKDLLNSTAKVYADFVSAVFGKNSLWGSWICGAANLIIFLLAMGALICHLITKKMYWYNKAVIVAGIIAFPGISCILDIVLKSKSLSFYILYSLFLFYVLMLFLIKECSENLTKSHLMYIVKRIVTLCFVMIMFENILFSNQTYELQKIMYERTAFVVGSILENMEEYEEYEAGVTEVVFIGDFKSNESLKALNENQVLHGGNNISVTSDRKFRSFALFLGSALNYTSDTKVLGIYNHNELVKSMPSYPNANYCQMIDGKMVVKLSE